MRSLIPLLTAAILVGSCTCDCNKCDAQYNGVRGYYTPQQPVPQYIYPQRQYVQPQYARPVQQPVQQYVQPAATFNPNQKVTGASNGEYRHGQVIDLPAGINRLHLTLLVDRNTWRSDPVQYKVAQWLTNGAPAKDGSPRSLNARLRAIQDQVAFHYTYTDDPNFAETARIDVMGNGTGVWLTGPDGKIKADRSAGAYLDRNLMANIGTPDELADLLIAGAEGFNERPQMQGLIPKAAETAVAAMSGSCSTCGTYTAGGPCPNCTPQPSPSPAPSVTVPAKIAPVTPSGKSSFNMAHLGVCCCVAGATIVGLGGLGYVAYSLPGVKR